MTVGAQAAAHCSEHSLGDCSRHQRFVHHIWTGCEQLRNRDQGALYLSRVARTNTSLASGGISMDAKITKVADRFVSAPTFAIIVLEIAALDQRRVIRPLLHLREHPPKLHHLVRLQ